MIYYLQKSISVLCENSNCNCSSKDDGFFSQLTLNVIPFEFIKEEKVFNIPEFYGLS